MKKKRDVYMWACVLIATIVCNVIVIELDVVDRTHNSADGNFIRYRKFYPSQNSKNCNRNILSEHEGDFPTVMKTKKKPLNGINSSLKLFVPELENEYENDNQFNDNYLAVEFCFQEENDLQNDVSINEFQKSKDVKQKEGVSGLDGVDDDIKKITSAFNESTKELSVDQFERHVKSILATHTGKKNLTNRIFIMRSAANQFRSHYSDSSKACAMQEKAIQSVEEVRLRLLYKRLNMYSRYAGYVYNKSDSRPDSAKAYLQVVTIFNHFYSRNRRYDQTTQHIYSECFRIYSSAATMAVSLTDNKEQLGKMYFIAGAFSEVCKNHPKKAMYINFLDSVTCDELKTIRLLQHQVSNKYPPLAKINNELKGSIHQVLMHLRNDIKLRSDRARSVFIDKDQLKRILEDELRF